MLVGWDESNKRFDRYMLSGKSTSCIFLQGTGNNRIVSGYFTWLTFLSLCCNLCESISCYSWTSIFVLRIFGDFDLSCSWGYRWVETVIKDLRVWKILTFSSLIRLSQVVLLIVKHFNKGSTRPFWAGWADGYARKKLSNISSWLPLQVYLGSHLRRRH